MRETVSRAPGALASLRPAALALFGLLKNRPGRAAEPAAAPAQGIR